MWIRKSTRSAQTPDSRAFATAFSGVTPHRNYEQRVVYGAGRRAKRVRSSHTKFLQPLPSLFAGIEIEAIRMMEYQRTHAGFRVHHHAIGQGHTNGLRFEQLPDALLILQIGTRRVAETIALAAIPGRE